MNRAFFPVMKSLGIAVLAVSSMIPAAYANTDAKAVKADPAKGEALYKAGDAARGIVACVSCHGDAAIPRFRSILNCLPSTTRIWLNS
jgi:cytochrome c553